MPRYFIEVSYNGTRYAGFQVQHNARTIQFEVTKALDICFHQEFKLTGASRTDAGVHALQNFFHFETEEELLYKTADGSKSSESMIRSLYSLNAILPWDIVIKKIMKVGPSAHARFDALTREYRYHIYQQKNAFYKEVAYFYPYPLDLRKLQEAALMIYNTVDFTTFSKRNTQVNNFNCTIHKSEWIVENDQIVYRIVGNRFLRGMVRGLVGTMLKVGAGKIDLETLSDIIKSKNCSRADFSVPPHGLFLTRITY